VNSRIPILVALLALGWGAVAGPARGGEAKAEAEADALHRWWKEARRRIEKTLEDQGRTADGLESPKWFEQAYTTVGRMPLVDTCLARPLIMPEVAGWADRRAKAAGGKLLPLFELAEALCNQAGGLRVVKVQRPQSEEVAGTIRSALSRSPHWGRLPKPLSDALFELIAGISYVHTLREKAFGGLTPAQRKRVAELLPAYFVKPSPAGESIRGYTTNVDDCVELIGLLRKVDFGALLLGARVTAELTDAVRAALRASTLPDLPAEKDALILRFEASFGTILIGGTGPNTYREEAALLVDFGGDDLYLNKAASASLDGAAASVLIDVAGNDRYLASGRAQACAAGGVAALVDMGGDDVYVSGHYSQGAALGGFSFFCEEGGDDRYTGQLGVQGFSIFGYSVFAECGGRDTYRCAAMGQGCASTLGVTVLAEGGGDDTYRAGGEYGFYVGWDSSCAQGAASGMRPWPPHGKRTVYGGVALLSEAGGNDTYHCYNIGQGGSYIFALGMLVDGAGDDVYYGKNYTRGVGVHLSAGVCIDEGGNDLHMGDYGQNAMSLDRSSAVFIDLGGDDVYRLKAGLGFATKPRGCAIFVEAGGDDVYAGSKRICGCPNAPYGDDAASSAYFFDFSGVDVYPDAKFGDGKTWTERLFGRGEDLDLREPKRGKAKWWAPATMKTAFHPGVEKASILSPWTLIRFSALGALETPDSAVMKTVLGAAAGDNPFARKDLIDLVRGWLLEKKITASATDLFTALLASDDRDLRMLGFFAMGECRVDDTTLLGLAGALAWADPCPDVRGMACHALGKSESEEAVGHLLQALRSPYWAVRRRAALAFTALKNPRAASPLMPVALMDPHPVVRARAAEALGASGSPGAVGGLRRAMLDEEIIVRFFAARALLKDFGQIEAMEHLFPLLAWKNGALRDRMLGRFLRAYTGRGLPLKTSAWRNWWAKARSKFDADLQGQVFQLYEDAEKAKREGNEDYAVELFRRIRDNDPKHAGACRDLSEILNSRAWGVAVAGGDYAQALKWAEESVKAQANTNNIDTLAVLQYLTGEKKKAIETLEARLKKAEGRDVELLKHRLEEFKKGSLNLR
jgi:hypothetical protein